MKGPAVGGPGSLKNLVLVGSLAENLGPGGPGKTLAVVSRLVLAEFSAKVVLAVQVSGLAVQVVLVAFDPGLVQLVLVVKKVEPGLRRCSFLDSFAGGPGGWWPRYCPKLYGEFSAKELEPRSVSLREGLPLSEFQELALSVMAGFDPEQLGAGSRS